MCSLFFDTFLVSAHISLPHYQDGWTALFSASVYGFTDMSKLFIEAGADMEARDNEVASAVEKLSIFMNPL